MSRESAAGDVAPAVDFRVQQAANLRLRLVAALDCGPALPADERTSVLTAFERAVFVGELGTAERLVLQAEGARRGVEAGLVDEEDGAPVDEAPPERHLMEEMRDAFGRADAGLAAAGEEPDPFRLLREETGDPALSGDGANALTLVSREELARGLDMVLVAVYSYFPPVKPGTTGYPEPLVVAQGHRLGARGELGAHVNVKLTAHPHVALARESAQGGVLWLDADRAAWFSELPSARSGELGTFWPVRRWQGPQARLEPCVVLLSIRYEGRGERADLYRTRVRGFHALATARGLARRDPSWRGFPAQVASERPGLPPPPAPRAPSPPPAESADLTGERPANRRPPAKGPAPKRAAPKRAPKGRGK